MARRLLVRTAAAFRDALYPNQCLICRNIFRPSAAVCRRSSNPAELFETVAAPYVCPSCEPSLLPVESPYCPMCGVMFNSRDGENHLCQQCISRPRRFASARACGRYESTLMSLIHSYKYRGDAQLAKPLGQLMFRTYIQMAAENPIDLVVPIPLHPSRFRQRGYNQAALLIKGWCQPDFNRNRQTPITIEKKALVRKKQTASQSGLNAKQRKINVKGAFRLVHPSRVYNKRILLVDDVFTTGATVEECARTLLNGGATSVHVLTLARTM